MSCTACSCVAETQCPSYIPPSDYVFPTAAITVFIVTISFSVALIPLNRLRIHSQSQTIRTVHKVVSGTLIAAAVMTLAMFTLLKYAEHLNQSYQSSVQLVSPAVYVLLAFSLALFVSLTWLLLLYWLLKKFLKSYTLLLFAIVATIAVVAATAALPPMRELAHKKAQQQTEERMRAELCGGDGLCIQ